VLLYRASRGRLLGRLAGMPVVLLTTTGRRSGRPRTVALTTVPHGDCLLLVGSFGGSDEAPAWLLNLRAHPRARVRWGDARWEVVARVASAEERERLWPVVVATHDGYARYQTRTARRIPVVVLTPGETGTPVRASPDDEAPARAHEGDPPAR
jgi:deazaflavin-dependent oxidoreductase (nitroreductase family)